jgi:hypothetical protein
MLLQWTRRSRVCWQLCVVGVLTHTKYVWHIQKEATVGFSTDSTAAAAVTPGWRATSTAPQFRSHVYLTVLERDRHQMTREILSG